ncbi:hypothetical protein GW17_00045416 [Ensete ventricosum]|nr:hypothetical protein GW17_00045416 [Ensete ventricosum]
MVGSIKLQPDDGPSYSLGIGPSSDDAMGSHQKFTRRFTEEIGKFTGNAKGDRQEEDRRTCHKIVGGCRRLPDYAGNPSDGQQVSTGKSPRWQLDRPYHRLRVAAND